MKTMFINAELTDVFTLSRNALNRLPQTLIVACTIQYIGSLNGIVQQINESGRTATLFAGPHSTQKGQILGCDLIEITLPLLYIGDGDFHPKTIAYTSTVDVYCYDPIGQTLTIVTQNEVKAITLRKKGAILKFKHATSIGVIISTKPGQQYLQRALQLEDDYPDKTFTYFLTDVLDFGELENYPFVEVWVNTACPRIGWDDIHRTEKPLIDLGDIDGKYSRR